MRERLEADAAFANLCRSASDFAEVLRCFMGERGCNVAGAANWGALLRETLGLALGELVIVNKWPSTAPRHSPLRIKSQPPSAYQLPTRRGPLLLTSPKSTLTFHHITMKVSTVCAAFFAAVVAASDVKQLNKDTFKSFVEENDLVLAECKCWELR